MPLRATVRAACWAGCLFVVAASAGPAPAFVNVFRVCGKDDVVDLNQKLAGQLLDFTANHRGDRRICSPALGEKRDLYVYLPPGYDGKTAYPLMIWLHGIGQDEKNFLFVAEKIDEAVRCGTFPPMVVVAPDGSIDGRPCLYNSGSFFVNSKAGRFEDWVADDVYAFAHRTFRVRKERGANVIAGGSMGGSGAFVLGFKHRDKFGQIVGIMPGLNARYADCHGDYHAEYDPDCVGWRTNLRPLMVLGRFKGVVPVRQGWLIRPLFDRGEDPLPFVIAHNPIEMLDAYRIRPGEFGIFIGYGTADELNLDAQAEQFADAARDRGIPLTLVAVQGGTHSTSSTGLKVFPHLGRWLTDRLGPYLPACPPGIVVGTLP